MQMLYPFRGSIQQYIEGVGSIEQANRCRPTRCPQCESKQRLVCHGFYKRTVVEFDWDGVIRVRRYLCKACRRTRLSFTRKNNFKSCPNGPTRRLVAAKGSLAER